jgi:hypothetical protein
VSASKVPHSRTIIAIVDNSRLLSIPHVLLAATLPFTTPTLPTHFKEDEQPSAQLKKTPS